MYISIFDHNIWYTNTAKSSTEKLISTVLDFDIKGNFAVLQPWTKIVETKVESLLNSRNESIFQFLNYPPWRSYINFKPGQGFLSNAYNFANNIELVGEGFLRLKLNLLFCLNSFVQDCRLLVFFKNTTPNCWMLLKCISVHCMLSI